jgi:DNA-binding response OmpR family regulator
MLIDDEADITKTLNDGLQRHGYDVETYNDPEVAIEKYKTNVFDRVITDIRMPTMNGFELARRIWQIDAGAGICFLTSFEIHEAEAKKVFPNLKDRCFVKKPLTPSQLAQHIQQHESRD